MTGDLILETKLKTDWIEEKTADAGVTIKGDLLPSTDAVYFLGKSGQRWGALYVADIHGGDTVVGLLYSGSHNPREDATYGLGLSGLRWRSLFLSGSAFVDGYVWTDYIRERTAGAGVTIVHPLHVNTISERTADAGVTVEGVLLKDSIINVDTIKEKTLDAGVKIEKTLFKDADVETDMDGRLRGFGNPATGREWEIKRYYNYGLGIYLKDGGLHNLFLGDLNYNNLTGNIATVRLQTGGYADGVVQFRSWDGTARVLIAEMGGGADLFYFYKSPVLDAEDATATDTTVDSPSLILRGSYWDGVSSVDRDATILHDIIDTTPTSQIGFEIEGTRLINFHQDGDIDLAVQTVQATAGALAGYATIKVGGTQYKIALYALA